MTGYNSGKRAEEGLPVANCDPEPYYRLYEGQRRRRITKREAWEKPAWFVNGFGETVTTYKNPRPEFDIPDNPILVWIRGEIARYGKYDGMTEEWIDSLKHWKMGHTLGGVPLMAYEIQHALRVITKLAALES